MIAGPEISQMIEEFKKMNSVAEFGCILVHAMTSKYPRVSVPIRWSHSCPFPELQKSHGCAGITREEGLQNGQSLRKF